jgi:hypothetical protein
MGSVSPVFVFVAGSEVGASPILEIGAVIVGPVVSPVDAGLLGFCSPRRVTQVPP